MGVGVGVCLFFTLKSKKPHEYLFFQSKICNFAACLLILSANG